MINKRFLTCSLAVALTACQGVGPQTATNQQSAVLNAETAKRPFRSSIALSGRPIAGASVELVKDGMRFQFEAKRLMLSGEPAAVQTVMKSRGLTLVHQVSFHEASLPGRSGKEVSLPYYIVEIKPTERPATADLDRLANEQGLDGEVQFSDTTAASTFLEALRIGEGRRSGCTASVLSFSKLQGSNAPLIEGDSERAPAYENTATPSQYFWWMAGPNEYPGFSGCNLYSLNGGSAWNYADGQGVRASVIDDGFLKANQQDATVSQEPPYIYNAVNDNNDIAGPGADPGDDRWHGRQVASLIFSPHNDRAGSVGVAPKSTPLFIRAGEASPNGAVLRDEAIARALECSISWGADVINMSLGRQMPWNNAIACAYYPSMKRAYEKGIISRS